jgi:hypothetical protein
VVDWNVIDGKRCPEYVLGELDTAGVGDDEFEALE